MSGPQPSAIPAGQASESVLGQNLRQSSDPEDLLGTVIRQGVSGRDDQIPSDGNQQTRTVSAQPYRSSWGMERGAGREAARQEVKG